MNRMKKKDGRGGARVGAGRKPTGKPTKKAKTLNLDAETHEALDRLKKITGRSQAVIVESLVKSAVKNPSVIE